MNRVLIKVAILSGIGVVLFACANGPATDELLRQGKALLDGNGQKQLTSDEISAGLKEALHVGTETVVAQLGRPDGFNKDRAIHIPLPDKLANVKSKLGRYGLDKNLADLELRLNRAAETATPLAKELFWKAIRNLSWSDIQGIYHGPPDAATRYFQTNMSPKLARTMRPVVEQALE
ncbi:MAG: DUF4197 domain-containing protein, partial [Gammaproteobacteria bacterium]|nr:DUF4197 domain-containing protein [Gammaproteobacteria bacterium]